MHVMTNAIILHGMPGRQEYYDTTAPSTSNSHWFPWLQKQLMIRDIAAATPEIPHAYSPDYVVWQREFERFDINEDTLLVGHSCGGGFLVRWLSEHPEVRVNRVVLVAPWIDPFREDTTDFFEFAMDPNVADRVGELWIFDSDNDSRGVHTSIEAIRSCIDGIKYREFHDYGHFCRKDLGTDAFPELLDTLVA